MITNLTFTVKTINQLNQVLSLLVKKIIIMGIFFNLTGNANAQDLPGKTDRQPVAAGKFYPSDSSELKQMLGKLFEAAQPKNLQNVRAVITPHAGYVYSGEVAANGFKLIDPDKEYDNVFIIASSHHIDFNGASVYNAGDYLTPLGKIKVNQELANQLITKNKVFSFNPDADLNEHSLEVQLPFLQYHLKHDFKIVPVIVGTRSAHTCNLIAQALKPWFNEHNLFIISTDFAHYPSFEDAVNIDKATCDAIITGSATKLQEHLKQRNDVKDLATKLCGWSSVLILLDLLEARPEFRIMPIQYLNSGNSKYGDRKSVVGYWSLAVCEVEGTESGITKEDKEELLSLARITLKVFLQNGTLLKQNPSNHLSHLMMNAGAFVTLRDSGRLRGCIGRFSSTVPLYRLIQELAVESAIHDSRFEPVKYNELDHLTIEISVLTPLKKIDSPDELILGKHGILVKKGSRSGTFLPQVASETGWNRDEFLGHCSRDKAGLGWDGWKQAELFIYESIVFSEDSIGHKD